LLAELDNASQQLAYQEAQQELSSLTSVSAIGDAQQALAMAERNSQGARLQLEYLIGPEVYYWENEIARDQDAVKTAGASAAAAPTDKIAQAELGRALAVLDFANDKLKSAQYSYKHEYVPATFTITRFNHVTNHLETYVEAPSAAEILKARQDISIANGGVDDAKALYTALSGGEIPGGASGPGLTALLQARADLLIAKENLAASQILAPFNGTVIAVNSQVGATVGTSSILTIADLSKLYMRAYVDESDYSMFKVGNHARVILDALPGQTLSGHVVEVDPILDNSSGSSAVSGLIELDATAQDMLIGVGGSVEIIGAQVQNAVIVPLAALRREASGNYSVFVMRGGKPVAQVVEVGLQDLVNAEIKSGLQAGDVVKVGTASSTR
jgi:membrane fusion protein, macrolide-specific efflux system